MYRQPEPVANASITPDILESLDIELHFAPQVTLDTIVFANVTIDACTFFFGEIVHACIRIDTYRL